MNVSATELTFIDLDEILFRFISFSEFDTSFIL